MAFTSREMRASAARAFSALVDVETYPDWLIGAGEVRDVDDAWPAAGSTFKHVVGVGPFRIPDNTEVLEIHDGELLRLKVRARPFIWAVATFRVLGDGERCVVTMQEEPAARLIGTSSARSWTRRCTCVTTARCDDWPGWSSRTRREDAGVRSAAWARPR